MMGWIGDICAKFPGFPELLTSEYAVKVYGQGHVVAYNYIAHWHDGIDVATYGNPDGAPGELPDRVPVAIDFYNNDLSHTTALASPDREREGRCRYLAGTKRCTRSPLKTSPV
jgi:hypothetical protein